VKIGYASSRLSEKKNARLFILSAREKIITLSYRLWDKRWMIEYAQTSIIVYDDEDTM